MVTGKLPRRVVSGTSPRVDPHSRVGRGGRRRSRAGRGTGGRWQNDDMRRPHGPARRTSRERESALHGRHVFPMREPIRLTDDSLALLGEQHRRMLVPLGLAGGAKGKSLFSVPDDHASWPLRPAALFVPRFTAPGSVRPIAPEVASELLWATNRLTLELNDFYWYT